MLPRGTIRPPLRGFLAGSMERYLSSLELDPKWLMDRLRGAIGEVRGGGADYHGLGWVFLLMTPEQRRMVRQMQATMSLLEGHANFAMNAAAGALVPSAARFRKTLHDRRNRSSIERAFHKLIGFDVKIRQYEVGERFVARAVDMVGMEAFNRVWRGVETLPTLEEIGRPESWVARVGA